MTDTFRALCAELLHLDSKKPSEYAGAVTYETWRQQWETAIVRARDALAAPKKPPNDVEIDALVHDCLEEDGYDLRVIVRAALARWGNPAPAPPVDGEVAELTGQLIEAANGAAAIGWNQHAQRILRAAELLQRMAPLPESE